MALPALLSGLGRKLLVEGAKGVAKDALFGKRDGGGNARKPPEDKNKSQSSSSSGKLAIRPSSSMVQSNFGNIGGQFRNNLKGGGNNLLTIKEKVARIENILGESYKFKKKQAEKERTLSERNKRKEREELLEKNPKEKENKGKNKIPIPGKGIFDNLVSRIFNFIFWVTIGKSLPTIQKLLPGIIGFLGVIFKIMDVIISVVGTILDSIITFVDWGFRVWDQVRGAAKAIGGDGLVDALDKFTSVVDTILNLLFIASMAAAAGGLFDKSGSKSSKKQNRPKITESGGKPLRRRDKIFDKLKSPFGSRGGPTITGDVPGGRRNRGPFDRGPKITGTPEAPKPKGRNIFSGLYEGAVGVYKGIAEGASSLYKNTVGKLAESANNLIKQGPKKLMEWMSDQKGIIGELGKKLPGFFDSPLVKKLGKSLPFVGDVVGFVFDIIDGIDWRRALIRAVVGASIDAGFNSLAAALVAATPFTGGASTAVAIALYASYMAADIISGGFGKILGDKVADFLKLPMKAGGDGGPSPKTAGSESDLKKVQAELDKKASEDPKFAEKIGRVPQQKQEIEDSKSSVPAKRYGGFIEYNDISQKFDEVPAKRFGGIVPLAFQEGGIISNKSNDYELDPKSKLNDKTDHSKRVKSTRIKTSLPNITSAAKDNKNVKDIYSGAGVKKLIDIGNQFKDIPIIGSTMYAAINFVLGNKVNTSIVDTIASDLIYFSTMDSFGKISSLPELNAMQNGGIVERDFGEIQSDMKNSESTLSKFLYSKINQEKVEKVTETEKKQSESGNAWWDPLGLFKKAPEPQESPRDNPDPNSSPDSPDSPDSSGGGLGGLTPNAKALLNTIRWAEGTSGSKGYDTWFGGRTDMDLSKMTISQVVAEQKRRLKSGEATYGRYKSAAVGAYQMMTPEVFASKAGLDPSKDLFTPQNQDKMAIAGYMKGQAKLTDSEINGPISKQLIAKMSGVWASLPNMSGVSAYGQPVKKYSDLEAKYNSYLGQAQQQANQKPKQSPDNSTPVSGKISPGGKINFIGSGATGKLDLIDASGKKVGTWNGISGVPRNAHTTQEQRKNVSGTLYPIPDGTYPLLNYARHSLMGNVGVWSTYINNASGSIGRRSQLLVHNDVNSDGTAGCVGVELGGRPNTTQEKRFLELYEKVQPKSIHISLASEKSKKPKPSKDNTGYKGGGLISPIKNQIIPDSFASYEEPGGTNTKIIMVPIPVPSQSPSMSPMVSKSLQSIPEMNSLNSMGSRMDQNHQLSRY